MRIIVFGATGTVGSRVMAEALARGHEVTAVVRRGEQLSLLPPGAQGVLGDATRLDQVVALVRGHDLIVAATRPPTGSEQDLVTAAETLLAASKETGVRVIFVGGAATLKVPTTGGMVLDDPRLVPPVVQPIAAACRLQHEACLGEPEADWTYLSPPGLLLPGLRTGRYRLGGDELLVDDDGTSAISIEDFAVALLDEAETPRHRRTRFTVAARGLALRETDVRVETHAGEVDCFFVRPEHGTFPGVLLWPDAVGMRPAFRSMAKRLAGSGFAVLAVNPYYRTTAAPLPVDMEGFAQAAGRAHVMALASAISPDMTRADTVALVDFLDRQDRVDRTRPMGAIGYCIGGAWALRAAAARADRIGAIATFHGSGLVTDRPDSPHRLVGATRASALVAIAENDDAKDPAAKEVLAKAWTAARLPAEIEVYAGAQHGWCVPDARAFNAMMAERAWSRLQFLLHGALTEANSAPPSAHL